MLIFTVLIYVLAVYRLTRLFVLEDGPFDVCVRWRVWLFQNAHRSRIIDMLAKAFDCKYCLGLWIAFIIGLLPQLLVIILAIAGGHALIEAYLETRE